MARRVKCIDTGEYSTSDVAYRAANGRYWSSAAAYQQHQDQMMWFHKCVELMMSELGYDENTPPTLVMKNLKRYEKVGYDVAYETITKQSNAIAWALRNKTFLKEFNKITYIFRIIDNNILDVYEAKKHRTKIEYKNQTVAVDDLAYDDSVGKVDKGHSVLHLIGEDIL